VLRADAWNHSFDILCTGTVLLGLWGARHGWIALDAWSALLVSVFIIYTGFRFAVETISKLLGEGPTHEEIDAIETIGMSFPFVHDVHDIMIHRYGDMRVVSFHVEMDAEHDAMVLHDEAEQIEAAVEKEMNCKAIVHVDPIDRNHPAYEKIRSGIEDVISANDSLRAFHDLRVSGPESALEISVDVVLYIGACDAEFNEWKKRIGDQIRAIAGPKARIEVRIEKLHDGRENTPK
jgi:divalent metal cation (Fe/Co/Zn/Cd) transporter